MPVSFWFKDRHLQCLLGTVSKTLLQQAEAGPWAGGRGGARSVSSGTRSSALPPLFQPNRSVKSPVSSRKTGARVSAN